MYSRSELADDFHRLGVLPGDIVMLHASVRAVGDIAGGPDQIHLALKDALTGDGTLIMYASCPQYVDEVGRGNLTPQQEREVLEKLPAFDPHTARAQRENGMLVEFFRNSAGTRVNAHVARFAIWGKETDDLIADQPWNYAFGRGSLLERFVERDGKILLLGCDHDNVTFLHYAEHIVDVPNKRVARFKVPVDEAGTRVWREMEEFDTAEGAHAAWRAGCFASIVDGFLTTTGNTGGTVGDAPSFLFSARALLDFAVPELTRLAESSLPAR